MSSRHNLFFYVLLWTGALASSPSQCVLGAQSQSTTPAGSLPKNCRVIPSDAQWPSQNDWIALNASTGGRLIRNVPIAAPCHQTLFGSSNPGYDTEKCDALRNVWNYPSTHLTSSSSPMAYTFSNNGCNPFSGPGTNCSIGFLPTYTVNATCESHIQVAVEFVKKHNIRLVIRNTGHDYLGKSTGAHALAVWTHYMDDIALVSKYVSKAYTGPALRLAAGVETNAAYEFAAAQKLTVVGGNCPTVGIAGGYLQGGGHGPLASKHGLGADQVLEWTVVTADGKVLTASANHNSDLYWALRGGGGSTFGIVTSVTIKAFPDTYVSMANFAVPIIGDNTDAVYDVMKTFLTTLPHLVDKGIMASWIATPIGFFLMPAYGPELHEGDLRDALQPTIDKISQHNLTHTYGVSEFPTFLSAYSSQTVAWNVSDYNLGGHLVPRALVEQNIDSVMSTIRYISSQTIVSGVSFNVRGGVESADDVGANPLLRDALFSLALGTPIDYADWAANIASVNRITNDFLPKVVQIAPEGGAYMNEADFQDQDFKSSFYGSHYARLNAIKEKYDPQDLFYAKTAVGSDRWTENVEGRLCRV